MNNKAKAILLSALVLPGLGQLLLGRKLKGGIMILLDNVFILCALFTALRAAGKLMLAGRTNTVDAAKVLESMQQQSPYALWLVAGFVLLWCYGVIDAALDKGI